MNGSTWRWDSKREKAALAFAEGKTWREIEQDPGVPHSTLAKWLKRPEFQARIDVYHEEIIAEARRYLRRNALNAAQRLVHLMESGYNQHGVKLQATKDLLDRVGVKATERTDGNSTAPAPTITIQVAALDYRAAVAVLTPPPAGSIRDSDAPGESESVGNGAALGEIYDGRRD